MRGKLPFNECLRLGLALSAALKHLHESGLIHRDIKPANIIFVNGLAKLADIGLVTDVGRSTFIGTEGYIPPEGPGQPQADIFALGKVLYEISSGKDRSDFPKLPTDLAEKLRQHRELRAFNKILAVACEPDARKRYQSAQELYDALARLQSGGKPSFWRLNFLTKICQRLFSSR